jgi:tetratricopeptide (TPR) repeat protein
LLERVIQLDPHSIYGLTQLAFELDREQNFANANGDDLDRAANLLAQAATIDPNNISVLVEKAHLLSVNNRNSEAVAAYQRVLDDYPNASGVYYLMGASMIPLGRAEEAIDLIKETLRRDPRNGWNYDRYADLGSALLVVGRNDEAATWFQRALAASPPYPIVRGYVNLHLAAAYARLGRLDEARATRAEANRNFPYATVRVASPGPPFPPNPVYAEQVRQYQVALRLTGLRDHADEDADFGVPADNKLRQNIPGYTPTTVPGATTIHTAELEQLLADRKPLVIDTLHNSWGQGIPGAVALKNVGRGGSTSDGMQEQLRKKLETLSKGDLATPIVVVGFNSERFDGYNLSLRLVAMGYTNVYWYRGGREAWEVAGLLETPVDIQDW